MEKVIYYFTGTGNSLRAARLIGRAMGGARLISMKCDPGRVPADRAHVVGFVCPVYEWDIPKPVREFVSRLAVNPRAYCFMAATYVGIHGKAFETMDSLLAEKGTGLQYARALRCVASQCVAYEPFPPAWLMTPLSDWGASRIGRQIAAREQRKRPAMSPLTRMLYPRLIAPFLAVQQHYDEGFFTTEDCIGCRTCVRVCPCGNLSFQGGRPVWNHHCEGCNACVAYCPVKAIRFRTPEAYARLDNFISRRLGLPETRTRYHHPAVTAADLTSRGERV